LGIDRSELDGVVGGPVRVGMVDVTQAVRKNRVLTNNIERIGNYL